MSLARAAVRPSSPAGEFVPGGQGVRVLRAEDPLDARAAARRTGPGRRPGPPPPRSSGRGCARAARVSRVLRAEDPLAARAAARRTGPGRRPDPPPPRSSGRGCARAARVSGCSGPRTRSRTGSSAANWSRAAAGSPASPVQRARLCAGGQGVRVLRAEDPLAHGQQRGELVPGGGRVPRLPGPAGEAAAGRPGCPGAPGRGPARARAAARRTGPGRRPGPPPPRSSGRGWRGRPGCPGAPGRGPARARAAARRTGPGPRPDPPPPRSSGRGCARAVRVSGCSGPRTRSRASRTLRWRSRAAA